MPTIRKRYPAGSITPHGAYYLMQGEVPTMKLRSWDDTSVFTLMGGENIPDYYNFPENVFVKDIKGLVPPWKQLDQKGATEDGRTFVTSLYDPAEVELTVVVKGKSARGIRRTVNDLIAAIDAIQTSELSWFTHDLGRWWSNVRWMDSYRDPEGGTRTLRQIVTLRLRAYDSFWRTYDVVDNFRISHTDAPGDFSADASALPSADWVVSTYGGGGTGTLTVAAGQVVPTLQNLSAVARRVGWSNALPVVEMQLGSFPNWYLDPSTAFDFWTLPTTDTTVGHNGYRLRVSTSTMTLSAFASGAETVLSVQPVARPPISGENWTFVGGPTFKAYRSGALVFSYKPASVTAYPAAGFGLHTSGYIAPPSIKAISFGSDTPATQSGYLSFVNWGDQAAPPRFTCSGPGTLSFGNGPNAGPDAMIAFGPLLQGQLMQVITDGQKRGVVDLTTNYPPASQDISAWQRAINDLLSFFTTTGGMINAVPLAEDFFSETAQAILQATGLAGTPLLQSIQSQYGVLPPQGNPYSLLQGMFSSAAYIPPKPAGAPPKLYRIPVSIENGTSDTQIIGAITPLRRIPY